MKKTEFEPLPSVGGNKVVKSKTVVTSLVTVISTVSRGLSSFFLVSGRKCFHWTKASQGGVITDIAL
ncbi:hypothetical protein Bpfe_010495, partial [Biomphalaria pfeifferi]